MCNLLIKRVKIGPAKYMGPNVLGIFIPSVWVSHLPNSLTCSQMSRSMRIMQENQAVTQVHRAVNQWLYK